MTKQNIKEIDPLHEFLYQSNLIEGIDDAIMLEQSLTAWEYLMTQDVLTFGVILRTHKILMLKDETLKGYERGYFRKVDVWVGDHKGIEPTKILTALVHWLTNVEDLVSNSKNEPAVFLERVVKEQHVEYEKIHPFVDGNGRTGRMFMNWTRVKGLGLPLLIIWNDEKQEYYNWFK